MFSAIEAGLAPLLEHLPEGLDAVVAERGASLSGGERQRVTLARALVRPAPILLLDEPTTGLDSATKREVVDTLLDVISERAAILATHDLELAARADEIVVLRSGRIVERGTHGQLSHESGEFRRLVEALEVQEA